MKVKSIIAVLLAVNLVIGGIEPLVVSASDSSNIVQNDLSEVLEADIAEAVELDDELESTDDSNSEEELRTWEESNDEDEIAEQVYIDEDLNEELSADEDIITEQIVSDEIEDESIVEDDASIGDEDSIEDELIEDDSEEETSANDSEIRGYKSRAMDGEEEDVNDIGDGLTFVINKGTLTISGNGYMRDWIGGYYSDVKAPWIHKDITSVIIDAGVKSIGDNAFESCSSIKSIVCKGNIEKIGIGAFNGCTSLEKLEFDGTVKFGRFTGIVNCENLNTLIFKKAAVFNDEAIYDKDASKMILPNLKTITFPDGSTFGKKSFCRCGLVSATFLGNVDLSAGDCFAYCPELKTVAFNGTGSTQNKITSNAFYYSNNISSITFKGPADIGSTIFVNLPELKTVTFPAGTTFGAGAFGGCNGLNSITFMGSADLSAGYCFSGCMGLKKLSFNGIGPEKSIISNNAFSGGVGITSITFKGPVDIGEAEFVSVQDIKSLTFGGDANIDYASFTACSNLTSVTFNGNAKLSSLAFYQCTNLSSINFKKSAEFDTEHDEIILSPFHECLNLTSITFGKGRTTLGEAALNGSHKLKSVTFNGPTWLAEGALSDCRALTSVTFNDYVNLDAKCFLGCDNIKLTILEFKKGATVSTDSSGNYAFMDSPITTVKFGDSSSLGDGAFKSCDSLKTVTFDGDADLGEYALSDCNNLTNVTCKGVTGVASYALSDCSNLKALNFAGELGTYDEGACSNLASLTTISFGDSVDLAAKSFLGCPKVSKVEFKKGAYIKTDSSGNYAFKDSPLNSVTFGENASLGDKAFYDCSTLTSVTFKKDANLGKDVLSNCSKLGSIKFGGRLSLLNDNPDVIGFCSNLPALTAVTFAGDTELPYGSFNNCNNSKLNKLAFGKAVTINTYSSGSVHPFKGSAVNTMTFGGHAVLKYGAFKNSDSIKTITFNDNASLAEDVFSTCAALTTVSFKGKVGTSYNLGVGALRDCKDLKTISFGSGDVHISNEACSKLPSLTSITFGGNAVLLGKCFNQCSNTKLNKLTFKGNASFRPTSEGSPFADCPIATLSIAGDADLRQHSFDNSDLTSVSLGASGKKVTVTNALTGCGLLKIVKMTGTITVTDSLNNCPELTTATIVYDSKKGESCSFIGEYFKYGCPSKITVNGKPVQYSEL